MKCVAGLEVSVRPWVSKREEKKIFLLAELEFLGQQRILNFINNCYQFINISITKKKRFFEKTIFISLSGFKLCFDIYQNFEFPKKIKFQRNLIFNSFHIISIDKNIDFLNFAFKI